MGDGRLSDRFGSSCVEKEETNKINLNQKLMHLQS